MSSLSNPIYAMICHGLSASKHTGKAAGQIYFGVPIVSYGLILIPPLHQCGLSPKYESTLVLEVEDYGNRITLQSQ